MNRSAILRWALAAALVVFAAGAKARGAEVRREPVDLNHGRR